MNELMNMIDLTPIVEALIGLLAMIITYRLVPWLKAKLTAQQQDLLWTTTRTLVYAAEQIYGSKTGEAKLAWVEGALEERGFKVDRAMIESIIKEFGNDLHSAKGEEKPPETAKVTE